MYLDDTKGYDLKEEWTCEPCPFVAECVKTATSLNSGLIPKEGFMALSWDETSFGRCPAPQACVVSSNGNDSALTNFSKSMEDAGNASHAYMYGHDGELCSQCLEGYARPLAGELCQECPENEYTTLLMLLAVVL